MGEKVYAEIAPRCFPKMLDTGKTVILCPALAKWLQRWDKFVPQYERAGGRLN